MRDISVAGQPGTALYDAIDLSVKTLKASSLPGHVLIVLTDGRDTSSNTSLDAAIAAARDANVAIYPIGIEGQDFDPAALQQLARETGGRYFGAASTGALTAVYSSIANTLSHTWRVSYVTSARPGDHITLDATIPGTGSGDVVPRGRDTRWRRHLGPDGVDPRAERARTASAERSRSASSSACS